MTAKEDLKEEWCFVCSLELLTSPCDLFGSFLLVSQTGCFSWCSLQMTVMKTILSVLQLPGLTVQTEAPNQQDKQLAVNSKYSMKDMTGTVLTTMSGISFQRIFFHLQGYQLLLASYSCQENNTPSDGTGVEELCLSYSRDTIVALLRSNASVSQHS